MLFEGKTTLKANIQKLWDSILDPQKLAACVPGMESLVLKENNVYDAVLKIKIGFIAVKGKGTVNMIELDPPKHLKGVIKGEALGGMGTIVGDVVCDFKEINKEEVELSYRMDLKITGKLAGFGDRVMNMKAKSMEAEMTKNFQEKLV